MSPPLRATALVVSALAACGPSAGTTSSASGSDTETVGSDSGGSATTESSSTTSTTSDGTETMPVECEQLDEAGCLRAMASSGNPCSWETFRSFTREGDVCTEGDPVSLCVELSGWTAGAGCGVPAGCEETGVVPFYQELPSGEVLIGSWCGGAPPVSFSACEDGLPEVTPGECACVCSLAGGSGTGGTGGTGVCDAASALTITDVTFQPVDPPDWNPGESVMVEATLHNPGEAFWAYPGIIVEAAHPDVTSVSPSNHLFGIDAGMTSPISVTFEAANTLPGDMNILFTVKVDALNQGCADLDQASEQMYLSP